MFRDRTTRKVIVPESGPQKPKGRSKASLKSAVAALAHHDPRITAAHYGPPARHFVRRMAAKYHGPSRRRCLLIYEVLRGRRSLHLNLSEAGAKAFAAGFNGCLLPGEALAVVVVRTAVIEGGKGVRHA